MRLRLVRLGAASVFAALSCLTGNVHAAEPAVAAPPLTRSEAEAFLDGTIPPLLRIADVPGAAVAVVSDGKIVLLKGYGLADVASRRPIDPERTAFRVGSLSKLFTWTAAMQLVEAGRLDLDRDINDYIDFKIPERFGKPITLRDLMTHTAGFEEAIEPIFVPSASDLQPLDVYLKRHIPRELFPPGTVVAYSNYGAILTGYIVQRVSGMPFEQYVATHIFDPLGMSSSTFVQPPPAAIMDQLATGYLQSTSDIRPFEYVDFVPAGALTTTAGDMAKFMLAQLGNGRYGNAEILRPATAKLMHAEHFQAAPGIPGMRFGFYDDYIHGHNVIQHTGDTLPFHAGVYLVLDRNAGFFIVVNGYGNGKIVPSEAAWQLFAQHFFPAHAAPAQPLPAEAALVAGHYESSRRADSTILKINNLQQIVVQPAPGGIVIPGSHDAFGNNNVALRVGELTYQSPVSHQSIYFIRNANGVVDRAVTGSAPVEELIRVPWYENSDLNTYILYFAVAVFILTLLAWPVGEVLRRVYGVPRDESAAALRRRVLLRVIAAANIIFVVGWFMNVNLLSLVKPMHDGQLGETLRLLQVFGVVGLAGFLVFVYTCLRGTLKLGKGRLPQIGAVCFLAAGCLFTLFAFQWNMFALDLRW